MAPIDMKHIQVRVKGPYAIRGRVVSSLPLKGKPRDSTSALCYLHLLVPCDTLNAVHSFQSDVLVVARSSGNTNRKVRSTPIIRLQRSIVPHVLM